MIKKSLLWLAGSPLAAWSVSAAERLDRERVDLLRILTYHRVDTPGARPTLNPSLLSATPQTFEAQMRFIAAHYTPVSAQDVLDYLRERQPLPRRAITVTFDDAYCDFAEHAWPVLKRYNIPATLFVPTAYPDNPDRRLWWDQLFDAVSRTTHPALAFDDQRLPLTTPAERLAAFKRLREHVKSLPHDQALAWVDSINAQLEVAPPAENHIMGWDALRQLAREGVTLAAHTRTHPILTQVSLDQAREEARASRRDLERETGPVLPVFAYPSGGFSRALADALQADGFEAAFTTVRGINRLTTANPLLLDRINIGSATPLPALRAQLLPSSAIIHRLRQ